MVPDLVIVGLRAVGFDVRQSQVERIVRCCAISGVPAAAGAAEQLIQIIAIKACKWYSLKGEPGIGCFFA